MKSQSEWSNQISSALNAIDPEISTEVGDPVRKIIDAVASVAASIDLNNQVNSSFFDLDSKSGADLDAIASWLGFGRYKGMPAVGKVRFYVDEPATHDIFIPAGTEVYASAISFHTTFATSISENGMEAYASIECDSTGISGNVNAYAINSTNVPSTVEIRVENQYNCINGYDAETDAELRKRIRQTFLRNVAGTEDAYRGISDSVNGTRRVNVVGPIERWEEELEVEQLGDGSLGFVSKVPCSKYTWPRQSYLVRDYGLPTEKAYQESYVLDNGKIHGGVYTVISGNDSKDKDGFVHPTVKISNNFASSLNSYSGEALDRLGSNLGVLREQATKASGTVVFRFDIAAGSVYRFKSGTELMYNGNTYYTTQDAVIESTAKFSNDVVVVAAKAGDTQSVPNGTRMQSPSISSVVNVFVQKDISGGKDAQNDEEYRKSIIKAWNADYAPSKGDHLFFKHEYTPIDSRNEPEAIERVNGVDIHNPKTNKVDVFVDGVQSHKITEVSLMSSVLLNDDTDSIWYCKNFYYENGTSPVAGTKIEVLGYAPVTIFPEEIHVNGATYRKGINYDFVKNQTLTSGSVREIDAIAWISNASIPQDGSFSEITYEYNKTIMLTDSLLDTNRQICTDVLCHAAKRVGLTINVIIQNVLGASNESILNDVNAALDAWADSMDFGQWIQFSDIETVIRQAIGIDACRIATQKDKWRKIDISDNTSAIGTKLQSGIQTHEKYRHYMNAQYDEDFRLWESMIPEIYQINICRTSSNTYNENYVPTK